MEWLYALSLLGSLLTGGFNVWQQRKQNKEVQDFNSEEAEKNRQWQEDMYNKYESPVAQVLQRTQAGLNPYGNVTSQSIGTGSTASSGSSSLPGIPDAFSLLPSQMMQLRSFKLDQSQKQATLDKTKEETNAIILDNQMKALEAGNREEWINLQMELLRKDIDNKKWSAEKLQAEAERAWDIANQSRQFTESGGNEFADAHKLVLSQLDNDESLRNLQSATIDQIKSDINLKDSQIELNKALEQYNNDKNNRENQLLVIETLYKNALIEVADSTVKVNHSNADKNLVDINLATNRDNREAALHVFNKSIAQYEASIKSSQAQTEAIKAYKTRVKNGDFDNLNDFLNGMAFLFADLVGIE